MPLNDTQLAMYPTLPWVRQRNATTLAKWAKDYRGYFQPGGNKPSPEDARRFIIADRIPQQMDSYVQRTLWFFAADSAVRDTPAFFSQVNTPEIEADLDQKNYGILQAFMDQFALTDVTDQQVTNWYIQHGFEEPPEVPAAPFITPPLPPQAR